MAAVTPPRSSRNASGSLWYLDGGSAHDGTDKPRAWHVTGLGCTPETADEEWRAVRRRFGKDGVRHVSDEAGERTEGAYVHAVTVIISASREEVDPDDPEAVARWHAQMEETAEELRDGHQVVLGTQTDGKSGLVHTHFTFNAVHPETGRSMNGRHPVKDMQRLKATVNEVSMTYGFDNEQHMKDHSRSNRRSAAELARRQSGEYVWKDDLDARLTAALDGAADRDEWRARAAAEGVEIRFRGKGVSYGFTDAEGTERSIAAKQLGSKWRTSNVDKVLAAEQAKRAQSAPTMTAPSKPEAAKRSGSFGAALGRTQPTRVARHRPEPAQPAPVEAEPASLPPYDRDEAHGPQLADHIDALATFKTGRATGEPARQESALDVLDRRAAKRAKRTGQSSAAAFDAELDQRLLQDGRTARQAAADRAAKAPTMSWHVAGETVAERRTRSQARVADMRRAMAEMNRQSQQRGQSRDYGMSM